MPTLPLRRLALWAAALALALPMGGGAQTQPQPVPKARPMVQPKAEAPAPVQPKPYEVTIAHQDSVVPMRVLIESGELEKATGYKITWRMFGGGGDVLKAMAAGEVQIGEAASTSLAVAASRSQEINLFWILDDIAQAEALVTRKSANINSLKDLKGKRVGTPFASTSHYQLMAALKREGLDPKEVDILNMRPQEIAMAWTRGDIDAAFIWDPVLSKIKFGEKIVKVPKVVKVPKPEKPGTQSDKTGTKSNKVEMIDKIEMVDKVEKVPNKIVATSGDIAKKAFPAFDGLVVNTRWAAANEAFMLALVQALARADDDYRKNGAKWTPESPQLKAVARLTRADPKDVPESMKLFRYPTLAEQASAAWLGSTEVKPGSGATPSGGAARALADTAAFLKTLGRVQDVKAEYKYYITDTYVKKALAVK
jgi:taurine transport system substrate-binding protein